MKKTFQLLILLPFLIFTAGFKINDDQIKTLSSLTKIDDQPFYVMTYYGDYGFNEYLKTGQIKLAASKNEISRKWACSSFYCQNDQGQYLYARNFDWYDQGSLLLFTNPPKGYAAVTIVDIAYLGKNLKIDNTLKSRLSFLGAPYCPVDGMNEYGLAVSCLSVGFYGNMNIDPQKPTINDYDLIRLVLENAKNVDEAAALLQEYNFIFNEPYCHYFIADAAGKSAVVEFILGKLNFVYNKKPWQVVTNFFIEDKDGYETCLRRCPRFDKAFSVLHEQNGILTNNEAMNLMKAISQETYCPTQWSALYNQTTGDIEIALGRRFHKIYRFTQKMRFQGK